MHTLIKRASLATLFISVFCNCSIVLAQSAGNSGTIYGTVTDATGAIIPSATVTIENPVSGYNRQTKTDSSGHYQFNNLPLNPYHLTISAPASPPSPRTSTFVPSSRSLSPAPSKSGATSTTVEVTTNGADLIENDPVGHTDVDRGLFDKLPLESAVLVAQLSGHAGLARRRRRLQRPLPRPRRPRFQLLLHRRPAHHRPAEQGLLQPASLQLRPVPRSHLRRAAGRVRRQDQPGDRGHHPLRPGRHHAHRLASPPPIGTFGSATGSVDLSYGGKNWGNFIEVDGLNTGRFLDPPEFTVFHDKGNEQNVFDRVDYQLHGRRFRSTSTSNYSRSWFQTPNTYDNLNVTNVISGGTGPNPVFGNVGDTDQRSKIGTYNIAPTYTRIVGTNSVFNFGGFVRRDQYNYYPSNNPLADLGPIQSESISQDRTLTNAGAASDFSYVKGINNIKVGAVYQQTFLREHDNLGLVNSTFNSPCVDANGNLAARLHRSSAMRRSRMSSPTIPSVGGTYNSDLLPYDLTRGGQFFNYFGHTDVKELALYVAGPDQGRQLALQPRHPRRPLQRPRHHAPGRTPRRRRVQHQADQHRSARLLRAHAGDALQREPRALQPRLRKRRPRSSARLHPRRLHHAAARLPQRVPRRPAAGLRQAPRRQRRLHLEVHPQRLRLQHPRQHADLLPHRLAQLEDPRLRPPRRRAQLPQLLRLRRHVLGRRPLLPAADRRSGRNRRSRAASPSASTTTRSSTRPPTSSTRSRSKRAPWVGFNWRYDSGLVAGSAPCYNVDRRQHPLSATSISIDGQPGVDLSGLTPDQQFQAGIACNGVQGHPHLRLHPVPRLTVHFQPPHASPHPTPRTTTRTRPASPRATSSTPPSATTTSSTATRHKWSLRLTAVNFTNKYALYNFLSTFSGTHYVTPRALTAEVGFHF